MAITRNHSDHQILSCIDFLPQQLFSIVHDHAASKVHLSEIHQNQFVLITEYILGQ